MCPLKERDVVLVNLFNDLPSIFSVFKQNRSPDGVVPTSQPNVAMSVCHAGKPWDKMKVVFVCVNINDRHVV